MNVSFAKKKTLHYIRCFRLYKGIAGFFLSPLHLENQQQTLSYERKDPDCRDTFWRSKGTFPYHRERSVLREMTNNFGFPGSLIWCPLPPADSLLIGAHVVQLREYPRSGGQSCHLVRLDLHGGMEKRVFWVHLHLYFSKKNKKNRISTDTK